MLIIDAYVGLTTQDHESLLLFTKNKLPYVVIANKVDKLKMGERVKKLAEIQKECGDVTIIPYSSYTGEGRDELMKLIFS